MIAGGVLTSQGSSMMMLSVYFNIRFIPFLFFSPGISLVLLLAGAILLLLGVALLIKGYQLYRKEKEWDQEMGFG